MRDAAGRPSKQSLCSGGILVFALFTVVACVSRSGVITGITVVGIIVILALTCARIRRFSLLVFGFAFAFIVVIVAFG